MNEVVVLPLLLATLRWSLVAVSWPLAVIKVTAEAEGVLEPEDEPPPTPPEERLEK